MTKPRVTKEDLKRAKEFIEALGVQPSMVEVLPGRVRIFAGGQALTLPDEDAELDRELAEHMNKRGYG